jgi:O-antigen ligase
VNWTPAAVVLLTSAILTTLLMRVFQVDRTILLAVQYFIWIGAAILIVRAARKSRTNAMALPKHPSKLILYFIFAVAISTIAVWLLGIRSDMTAVGLESAALIFMTLPFFVFQRIARTADVERAVIWTCHVILALGLYSIVGEFLGWSHYELYGQRYFGVLGDAVAWALTLPLIIYFASSRIMLSALAALGLLFTASRAPALVSVGALILLMMFSRGRRFQYVAMVLVLSIVALVQSHLFDTLLRRLGATQFGSSDRMLTARLGLKIFAESPIFGSGYNSLTHFYPGVALRSSLGVLPAQTSTFVQMLSDGGLVTFLAYMAFVIACSTRGISAMRRAQNSKEAAIVTGLAAWLVAILWINQSALWFVVGSYVGPLVFGMAGVLTGYWTRYAQTSASQAAMNSAELSEAQLIPPVRNDV